MGKDSKLELLIWLLLQKNSDGYEYSDWFSSKETVVSEKKIEIVVFHTSTTISTKYILFP